LTGEFAGVRPQIGQGRAVDTVDAADEEHRRVAGDERYDQVPIGLGSPDRLARVRYGFFKANRVRERPARASLW
jgi:hypothetical protein